MKSSADSRKSCSLAPGSGASRCSCRSGWLVDVTGRHYAPPERVSALLLRLPRRRSGVADRVSHDRFGSDPAAAADDPGDAREVQLRHDADRGRTARRESRASTRRRWCRMHCWACCSSCRTGRRGQSAVEQPGSSVSRRERVGVFERRDRIDAKLGSRRSHLNQRPDTLEAPAMSTVHHSGSGSGVRFCGEIVLTNHDRVACDCAHSWPGGGFWVLTLLVGWISRRASIEASVSTFLGLWLAGFAGAPIGNAPACFFGPCVAMLDARVGARGRSW